MASPCPDPPAFCGLPSEACCSWERLADEALATCAPVEGTSPYGQCAYGHDPEFPGLPAYRCHGAVQAWLDALGMRTFGQPMPEIAVFPTCSPTHATTCMRERP